MKLTSTHKMLAVGLLVLLAVVLAVVLLILPRFAELAELESRRAAVDWEVADAQTQLKQLQQARKEAAVTQARILEYANKIPDRADQPSLIIELQDAANSSGLRWSRFSFPADIEEVEGVAYASIPITVNLVGQWSDMLDYMRRLNKMTRAVRVESISLTPGEKASDSDKPAEGSPELEAELIVTAFVASSGGGQPASAGTPPPVAASP